MPEGLQRWWHRPDHYYWMTAYLAAQGAQATVCRAMALSTTGLGLMPLVMLASPDGPQGTVNRLLVVAVAACCIVVSLMWLRPTWPSQRASAAFVVLASAGIAATCLVAEDPVGRVMVATAFAVLGAYIGFFHTARYVLFNMVVAAIVVGLAAVRLAQERDIVFALCVAAFVLSVNILVSVACQTLVHMLEVDVLTSDIDTVTGLLNKEAFYQQTSDLIGARNRGDDRYLVIAVTTLDHFRMLAENHGRVASDRARVAIGQTLRDVTRHNAVVAHTGGEDFLIADTFQTTDVSPLVDRVRSAIATTPPKLTASVGVVSTPLKGLANTPSHDVLDEMVTIATVAMFDARLAGGNQVRYVECPPLRVLDDRLED